MVSIARTAVALSVLCLAACGSANSRGLQPQAPIVVFVGQASWMTDPAMYGTLADTLRAGGYDVRTYPLPMEGDLQQWARQPDATWVSDYVAGFKSFLPTLGNAPAVVVGTSRGAFCALQLAAAYPVLKYVVGMAPAVDLAQLTEFAGNPAAPNLYGLAAALADKSIFMEIGTQDDRVGSVLPANLAYAIGKTTTLQPDITVLMAPANGHTVPARTFDNAAAWIAERVKF